MVRTGTWLAAFALLALVAFLLVGCGDPGAEDNGGTTTDNGNGNGEDTTPDNGNGEENDDAPEGPQELETLKIGVVLPMNGPIATSGREASNGLRLSGLNGFRHGNIVVEVLPIYDNNSEAIRTRSMVETAVQEGAQLIIGAVASSNTRAGASVAFAEEMIMISPASTNVELTRENEFLTRVCFTDDVQGAAAAELVVSVLEEKGFGQDEWSAGILLAQGNAYSIGLAAQFRQRFEELGGTIVANASFQEDDSQFESQIGDIAAGNPRAVFIPAYYDRVGVILRQAREEWDGMYIFGGDGWDSPDLFGLAGRALGDLECYITSHFVADENRDEVRRFVEQYERRFEGDLPGAMAALGYDTGLVVRDAVARAVDAAGGLPDRHQLREAVLNTRGVRGVTGEITIDPETREVTKRPILARVTEDGLALYEPSR